MKNKLMKMVLTLGLVILLCSIPSALAGGDIRSKAEAGDVYYDFEAGKITGQLADGEFGGYRSVCVEPKVILLGVPFFSLSNRYLRPHITCEYNVSYLEHNYDIVLKIYLSFNGGEPEKYEIPIDEPYKVYTADLCSIAERLHFGVFQIEINAELWMDGKIAASNSNGGRITVVPNRFDTSYLETNPFVQRLFERFPNAFPILRHLLGYD